MYLRHQSAKLCKHFHFFLSIKTALVGGNARKHLFNQVSVRKILIFTGEKLYVGTTDAVFEQGFRQKRNLSILGPPFALVKLKNIGLAVEGKLKHLVVGYLLDRRHIVDRGTKKALCQLNCIL